MTPCGRAWPVLTDEDFGAVRRVLERGVLTGTLAPEIAALEREFAAFVGVRFCLATNSGTAALHIALVAAGVGPGDEVIVPALSFVATAQAVLHAGARPVFADIDPCTYNLDVADARRRITARTRAIMPVHLHGLPADMDDVRALADAHGLAVVEDAAQAHGATYHGRMAGSLAPVAAFSINATKNLPAGEGGLFVTDDEAAYHRAAAARFNGFPRDGVWNPTHPLDDESNQLALAHGFMYLPGEITCALARTQLGRLHEVTARARANGARFSARLADVPGLEPPAIPDDRTHVFHKYRLRFDAARAGFEGRETALRDDLVPRLRSAGVEVALWQTVPLPHHPLFGIAEPYPRTARALASTLVVGSQSYPLFAQPEEVIDTWADAFTKVWMRILQRG